MQLEKSIGSKHCLAKRGIWLRGGCVLGQNKRNLLTGPYWNYLVFRVSNESRLRHQRQKSRFPGGFFVFSRHSAYRPWLLPFRLLLPSWSSILALTVALELIWIFCYDAVNFDFSPTTLSPESASALPFQNRGDKNFKAIYPPRIGWRRKDEMRTSAGS